MVLVVGTFANAYRGDSGIADHRIDIMGRQMKNERLTTHEMEVALAEHLERMPIQIKFAASMAKITRAKYLALRLEGFSDEQALELSK
jgi:hypothetical protein